MMSDFTTYNPLFMNRAVELSEMAYKSGKGLPIGCVISKNGSIIGEGHNEIFSRTNPTAHGEMVAIEQACKQSGNLQLTDCELYTTLEPCPMCFGAIYWANIKVVYFANTTQDALEAGFDDGFIFQELKKSSDKRKIPMIHQKHPDALKTLIDWKALTVNSAQPWKDIRS